MATHRIPVSINKPDAGCPVSLFSTEITSAATPSIGDHLCYVLADGGSDEGLRIKFTVPKNYVGTPKLIVRGVLDGTPGAGDDLGFGFRKRAVADNESADGTFDAEQTVQVTDMSVYANEDEFEMAIDLTAGDFAVDDSVRGYFYIDASGTTYVGNVLLDVDDCLFFQYTDT